MSAEDNGDFVVLGGKDALDFKADGILPQSPEALQKIRKWLRPTDYDAVSSEYVKHLASYAPGTGDWIRDSPEFKEWHASSEVGALWIKAIPGAGKSVAAAHLASFLERTERVPVLRFFFRQIITTNRSHISLLRDWLAQILDYSPSLQARLKPLVEKSHAFDTISSAEIVNHLRDAIESFPRVYCIADALDEMNIDESIIPFLNQLISLGNFRPSSVKILMTSRPLPHLTKILNCPSVLQITIRPQLVEPDIQIYAKQRLDSTEIPDGTKAAIQQAICNRAGGLFLYARLMMDDLQLVPGKHNFSQIQSLLNNLPTGLGEMYTQLLHDHSVRSGVPQQLQLIILRLVTHASRPLRLLEIADILDFVRDTMNPDIFGKATSGDSKSIVRNACGPLLEILIDDTVSIIHHSFTEFLTDCERNVNLSTTLYFPLINSEETHKELALFSIKYLSNGGAEELVVNKEKTSYPGTNYSSVCLKHPFLTYAVDHWHFHISQAGAMNQEILPLLDQFFRTKSKTLEAYIAVDEVESWYSSFEYRFEQAVLKEKPEPETTRLHIAVQKDLYFYTEYLLQNFQSGVALLPSDNPASSIIEAQGSKETISINQRESLRFRTPLQIAAEKGYLKMVSLLLKYGAAVNLPESSGWSPVICAIHRPDIISLLLEAGADLLLRDGRSFNPEESCECGRVISGSLEGTIFQELCLNGSAESLRVCLPYLSSETLSEALYLTASHCKPDLFLMLVDIPGVDIHKNFNGESLLQATAHCKMAKCVSKLLEMGVSIDISSSGKFEACEEPNHDIALSPLHVFARSACTIDEMISSADTLKVLVDAGCDINAIDSTLKTPLHYILESSGEVERYWRDDKDHYDDTFNLVNLFLRNGANPSMASKDGRTPLHLIPNEGKTEGADRIIRLLIDAGADVNACETVHGRTPLFDSLGQRENTNFLALIDRGVDCNVQDIDGNTPLHHLLGLECKQKIQIAQIKALIEHGADLSTKNKNGETPLHSLVSLDDAILDTLISLGVDLDSTDDSGCTLLMYAVQRWHFKDITSLIERGASASVRDSDGKTVLHMFCENHHSVKVLQQLIDAGAVPKLSDYSGNTLFHVVAQKKHLSHNCDSEELVQLLDMLLKVGVSPSAPNKLGETPLHLITRLQEYKVYLWGVDPLYEFFCGSKCRIDADFADTRGIRPIHIAVTRSEAHVQRLLRDGADPFAITNEGQSTLQIAARVRSSGILGLLLELSLAQRDSFVDHIDEKGRTALHYACRSGRVESVQMLLEAGANPNVKDNEKLTPLDFCAEYIQERLHWDSSSLKNRDQSDITHSVLLADPIRLDDGEEGNRGIVESRLEKPDGFEIQIKSERQTVGIRRIIRLLVAYGANISLLKSDVATTHTRSRRNHDYLDEESKTIERALRFRNEIMVDELLSIQHSLENNGKQSKGSKPPQAASLLEESLSTRARMVPNSPAPLDDIEQQMEQIQTFLQLEIHGWVERLHREGFDFCRPAKSGISAVSLMVRWGYIQHLEKLHELISPSQPDWLKNLDKLEGTVQNNGYDHTRSILIVACQRHLPNLEVVKFLVEQGGVDVNQVDRNSWSPTNSTALHTLATSNLWWTGQAMEYLIEKGAGVNACDIKHNTPLFNAMKSFERPTAAKTLLHLGANPNILGEYQLSCFNVADRDMDRVRLLIAWGGDIQGGRTPWIFHAIATKDVNIVRFALENGANPNLRPNPEPAIEAELESNRYHRDDILRHGPTTRASEHNLLFNDFDFRDPFPVHYAAHAKEFGSEKSKSKMIPIIDVLLKAGADPTLEHRDGISILHDLCEHDGIIQPFLDRPDFDPEKRDSKGRSLLLAGCCNTSFNLWPKLDFQYSSDSEEEEETTDYEQETREWWDSQSTAVELLLEYGADIGATDNQGQNALHYLLQKIVERPKCSTRRNFSTLIQEDGISMIVRQKDNLGFTPLHHALTHANIWAVETLLHLGADPIEPDPNGNTALHHLAPLLTEDTETKRDADDRAAARLFKLFLARGIQINATNNEGESAIFPYMRRVNNQMKYYSLFTENGASSTMTNEQGQNLLHILATVTPYYGYKPGEYPVVVMFKLLMQHGLDPMAEDLEHRTAVDIASTLKNRKIMELFRPDKK